MTSMVFGISFFSLFPLSASRTSTLAEAIAVIVICSFKGSEGSGKFDSVDGDISGLTSLHLRSLN